MKCSSIVLQDSSAYLHVFPCDLSSACCRLGIGSASARHRLGFDLARACNWHGIGSASAVAPFAVGIVPESPSAPPRHRLSIGSTSPRHRPGLGLVSCFGSAPAWLRRLHRVIWASAVARYRIDIGLTSARLRLGIGSASARHRFCWTLGGGPQVALHSMNCMRSGNRLRIPACNDVPAEWTKPREGLPASLSSKVPPDPTASNPATHLCRSAYTCLKHVA